MDNNGKIEFTSQYGDGMPKVVITLHPDSTLDQVLEAFQGFLVATGYSVGGEIGIIEKEETHESSDI